MNKTNAKKSPLRNPPLRTPAQSLIEYKDSLISDKTVVYYFWPAILVMLAGCEWARYFFHLKPHPWPISIMAACALAFGAYKLVKLRKHVVSINRGIEGEKSVGQFLEQFRVNGYEVFHDIPGDSIKGEEHNIDHVMIGPGGVFTVETKYAQKPSKGQCIIEREGDVLRINGMEPSRNPIIQSKAQSKELARILEASTGQKYAVQPIVVYPGWYIQNKTPDTSVLVLNEKMIAHALSNSNVSLAPDKIHLAVYHLSRHILSIDRDKK